MQLQLQALILDKLKYGGAVNVRITKCLFKNIYSRIDNLPPFSFEVG